MNPFFLPILLIILAAKKENTAVPTIDNDVGRVASDAIGEIFNPTIPLIKTVIGGAVKEKTWQIVKIIKFLLSTLFFNSFFELLMTSNSEFFQTPIIIRPRC